MELRMLVVLVSYLEKFHSSSLPWMCMNFLQYFKKPIFPKEGKTNLSVLTLDDLYICH